jgi:hypothetical protein
MTSPPGIRNGENQRPKEERERGRRLTSWCADETGANIVILLVQRPDLYTEGTAKKQRRGKEGRMNGARQSSESQQDASMYFPLKKSFHPARAEEARTEGLQEAIRTFRGRS